MNPPAKHRYRVLDSLRGICACMVILYHFHTVGWFSNLPLVRNSWLFVDFFFVLSGFVITTAYRRKIAGGLATASFMWLRMGRIYPVHVFVLGLFLVVQLVLLAKHGGAGAFQNDMTVGGFFSSLSLTNAFFTDNGVGWNGPSWSTAVEMWTYLVFAAIFRVFTARTSLAVVCLVVAMASCLYIAVVDGGNMHSFHFSAFFRCTYGFALGVIGAEFFPMIKGRLAPASTIAELAAIAIVGIVIAAVGMGPYSMLAPPMFLAVILIFANEGGLVSTALQTRFPLLLGELSYSIYMIHMFIVFRTTGIMDIISKGRFSPLLMCDSNHVCTGSRYSLVADAMIVPVFAGVIAAAYLLRNYIEAPCERWAKTVLARRTPAVDVTSHAGGSSAPEPPDITLRQSA